MPENFSLDSSDKQYKNRLSHSVCKKKLKIIKPL